jgi:tetratricopeptide (TPR) repeat protein
VILNKSNINKRLFDLQVFKESEMLEFKEIIGLYPYASVFAIAYLRGLKKMEHIQFEEELHQHAFKIANRNVLYQLVNQLEEETEAETETEEKAKVDTEAKVDAVVELVTEAETETETVAEVEVATETETEELIHPVSETTEKADTELETLINASAATTTFIHEFNQQGAEVDTELAKNELPKESKAIPSKAEIESTPKSFNQWLTLGETTNNPELEEKKTTMISIEKPKREFYSPSKKAKESIDGNKMPVSETLAKIFVLQGNYPKAIYVYEQLIIIYPKKKSIFASQIKQLSNKLIN